MLSVVGAIPCGCPLSVISYFNWLFNLIALLKVYHTYSANSMIKLDILVLKAKISEF